MDFRFVHTADWQLGKPFGGMPDDLRPVLAQARLEAIDRLAEVARSAGARHVLVAGDVFDAVDVPRKVIAGPVERMKRHDGLVWHLLPGNHDPHAAGGLWERLAPTLPANIRAQLEPHPVEIESGIWLLPAPLTRRAQAEDPTAWMGTAATPEGGLRIGLAHGSVQGFGSLGEAAVPISPARAQAAGLAYLALGDWHGTKRIAERVWYSGTPEPDQFADNGAGQALVVTARRSGPPQVETVATARYRWITREAEVGSAADARRIIDEIADGLGKPQGVLLRLVLRGRVPIAAHADIAATLEEARPVFAYLDVDDRALESLVEEGVQSTFAEDDVLAAVVARLSREAGDAGCSGQAVARQALRLIGQLAVEERGGARR